MRYLKLIICLLILQPAFAQIQEQSIEAKIEAVKIYLQGAEIIQAKELNLPQGKHRLIFTGLSPNIHPQSIQVTATGNTSLLSVTSKTNFLKPKEAKGSAKIMLDSIQMLRYELEALDDLNKAFAKEEEVLKQNQDLKGTQNNLTTDDLVKVANFYRERFREIYKERTRINRKMNEMHQTISRLNGQLSQLNADSRPTSEIYLELNAKSSGKTTVKVRYVAINAGWSPIYDLKAGELNEPINLNYRALVFNNTGIDWDEVNITLSTSDPNQSASKPLLATWYLNQNAVANDFKFNQDQGRMNNANVQIMDNMGRDDFSLDNTLPSTESGGTRIRFETIEISELSNDFVIAEPYSIPSNSKPYSIDIKNHSLNASYRHYVVPKMDKDAFLLAQITGWEELDLIDGPMNVYHKDSYIGQANLSTRTLRDTLDLSLGRDKNVLVTRVKQKELSKKQFFGSDNKVTRAYKISVKNNHRFAIDIEIQDQIPLSSNKDIVVELIDKSKADYNAITGKLVWEFKNMKPADTQSVNFSFSIKHPKEMEVIYEKKRSTVTPRYY
jgi:uncharacterized protein (TIGR02231 family)